MFISFLHPRMQVYLKRFSYYTVYYSVNFIITLFLACNEVFGVIIIIMIMNGKYLSAPHDTTRCNTA